MRPAPLVLLCALSLLSPAVVHAQETSLAQLREQGKAAIKERRLDDAVDVFRRGLQQAERGTEVRWQMMLGLALAHELKNEAPLATHYYRAFLHASEGHPRATDGRWTERRSTAAADADRIEPKVLATHARVDVATSTPGVAVELDGLPPGDLATPATLYLPPGQHQLELTKEGFAPMVLVVSVAEGQKVSLERTLLPLPEPEAVPAPKPVPDPEPVPVPVPVPSPPPPPVIVEKTRPSPELGVLGWTLVGVGAGAAIGGAIWTGLAASTSSELDALARPLEGGDVARDADLRGSLRNQQAASAGFYAAGGALAVGGLLVLLLRPDDDAQVRPSARWLGIEGRF